MNRKHFLLLFFVLTIGILISFFSLDKVPLNQLEKSISQLKIIYVLIAIICILSSYVFEAFVIKILVNRYARKYSLKQAIKTILVEQLFNGITPFATGGQPAQLFMLTRLGIDSGKAISSLLMKFIVYQAMIVINFLICLFIGYEYLASKIHLMAYLLILGFLVHFLVIIFLSMTMFWYDFTKKLLIFFLWPVKKLIKSEKYLKLYLFLERKMASFHEESRYLRDNVKLIVKISLITFVELLFYYVVPYFILLALNVKNVDIGIVIILHILIVMVISLFPIPGGEGGAEFSFSLIFSTFVMENTKLILAMILWRFVTYYLGILLGLITFASNNITNKKRNCRDFK